MSCECVFFVCWGSPPVGGVGGIPALEEHDNNNYSRGGGDLWWCKG